MRFLSIFIVVILFFSGCSKESIDTLNRSLQSGTNVRINQIYFTDSQTGFAVGGIQWEKGVVLKTTDGGNTWIEIEMPENFNLQTLYDVHFYNSQVGQIVGLGGKILRTEDGGSTWELVQEPGWEMLRSIHMTDEDNYVLVAGDGSFGGHTIYTMNDTWWMLGKDSTSISLRSVSMKTATEGFAVGYGGAYFTNNAGVSWQPTEIKGDFFKTIQFVDSETGYICGFQGSVLKTTDGGATWQNTNRKNGAFFRGTKLESLHFFDENIGLVCGLSGTLLYTDNGGEDWKKVNLNTSENLRTVFFTQNNKAIVAGDKGLMWEVIF